MKKIIALVGASGSGKTTLSGTLVDSYSSQGGNVISITQDDYYNCLSKVSSEERAFCNFDHPSSIDFDLIFDSLVSFKENKPFRVPSYDFNTHSRLNEYTEIIDGDMLIIDGILLLHRADIRELLDFSCFIDTPLDVCLVRRIRRDMKERGRSLESVLKQYENSVRSAYHEHVIPTKQYADLVVTDCNPETISNIMNHLKG